MLSSPASTSVGWSEPRSICEYDRTAATRSEMRRVDTFTSDSKVTAANVLATQSSPGSRLSTSSTAAARTHQARSTPSSGQRLGDHPVPLDPVAREPGRDRVLLVGDVERIQSDGLRLDLPAQLVECGQLRRRDLPLRQPVERGDQRLADALERVRRTRGGRRRIVDLVRETGRERSKRDQRLALPRGRLDGPCRAIHTLDEMSPEREPESVSSRNT